MDFKIENAKNLKMEFKRLLKHGISVHRDFIYFFYIYHWLAHRDIKEALRKRPGLGY